MVITVTNLAFSPGELICFWEPPCRPLGPLDLLLGGPWPAFGVSDLRLGLKLVFGAPWPSFGAHALLLVPLYSHGLGIHHLYI